MSIPYNPMPFSGGTAIDPGFISGQCSASAHDDCWAGPFDIGFTFCFLNVDYTQFYVGSNGWISFSLPNNGWNNYTPDTLPNSSNNTPKNCIMAPWQDWFPGVGGVGNNIYYYTSGTAPDRKCVVYWLNCPMYSCTTTYGTFQIVLNEQNSIIENNIQLKPACPGYQGNKATQGVQNATGTVAFIATGRNNSSWTASNESTRFVPGGMTWYIGGYPGGTPVGYTPTINVSPAITTTYTGVAEVCGGLYSAANAKVTVMNSSFHYLPSAWCQNITDPVPQLDTTAGIFTATPPGLVFANDITGTIDLSASIPGTYSVTHTITIPCTISSSQNITNYAPPVAPPAVNPEVWRCGPGSITISVIVGAHIGVLWYDAPAGGSQYPFTGSSVTPNITDTTRYYAEAYDSITGCFSSTRTMIMAYVRPIPDILNTDRHDTICSGFNNNFLLLATPATTGFSWIASVTIGNISGFTSPGTGNLISDNLTNLLFTMGEVTYTVTPALNGCTGTSKTFITDVKPKPNVICQPSSAQLCSSQITNFNISSNVSGTTFSWTATGSSPNVSGFADGNGNQIIQTLLNSGNTIETVTYVITGMSAGCFSSPVTVVVTVNPVSLLTTTPLTQTLCSQALTNIPLTSNVAGTTFSWTVALTSGNISGFSPGGGNQISQALTNNGYIPGVITYTISTLFNGCPGSITDYAVTVNPTPDISNTPLSKQICNNFNTNLPLLSNVAGTNFTWTTAGSSGNVTGYSDGSGLSIDQILVNSGFNNETVTYSITPHANGCDGITRNYMVTVYPVPDVYFSPAGQTLCSGQATGISLLSHVTVTTFSWTTTPSGPTLSGYFDGTRNNITQTLFNSGILFDSITYHVTPVANGCPAGQTMDVKIIVKPKPILTTTPLSKFICNANPTNITLTSTIAGTTFTWTAGGSSGNVAGYNGGSEPFINQTLTNSGYNIETVTYTIILHSNGCDGNPTIYVVSVYPVPNVLFNPTTQTICSGTQTGINLSSSSAGANFTWTATGSSGNISGFSAGAGNQIIQTLIISNYSIQSVTYTVTPHISTCNGIVRQVVVIVDPLMTTTFGVCVDTITILNAQPIKLKGGIPLGGIYSGPGVNSVTGIFTPGTAGLGSHTLIYSYVNQYTCNNNATRVVHVITSPFLNCGDTLIDIRDSRHYPTVLIGTQCWMAANLNYGAYLATTSYQRDNCILEKYCYNNTSANCLISGGLYQWDEIMQYKVTEGVQGFCPPGWHIPGQNDWNLLFSNFINNGFAGLPLKYTGYSGFNALLNGAGFMNKSWRFDSFATYFWTSTALGLRKAWAHAMNSYDASVSNYPSYRSNAFHVRCIKD